MGPDRRPDRLAALRRRLAETALDGLLVSHPANIRYLTWFSGSAGMLLVTSARTVLITDARYASQAPAESGQVAEVEIEAANLWDRLRRVLAAAPIRVLGFEKDRMTVAATERLHGAAQARLEPVSGLVEALRLQKDPAEVEAIRAAAALAMDALDEVLPTIRAGQSELAVAAALERALRVRGSEWHPFQTIVASGPRSALPHARATGREIARGDLLLLDFGAQLDGYCADLTRTTVIGAPPDGRQHEVYAAVLAAQRAALTGIRPGMTGREADAVARETLRRSGLAEAFRHSLGHGLGLEVHEDPRLAPTAEAALPVGAVVTLEPGVYFEGWGGVRLEDDAVLAPEGPELLSPGAPELADPA
ncbi:MAG TPA: Xaa-Pro peptidase family protein [Gemmatimonadales bacterium]